MAPARPSASPDPLWKRALPFLFAAGLMVFVLGRIEWPEFAAQLQRVDYAGFLGFVVVFVMVLLVADTLANVQVYKTIARVSFRDLFMVRAASYLPSLVNHHVGQAWLTYLLSRTYGRPIKQVVGATLLGYVTWAGCLLCLAAVSLLAAGFSVAWMAVPLVAGLLYLALLWWRPARLANTFLEPLFAAGVGGHLIIMMLRIPHLVILFVGTWVPFFFFGVEIPFSAALVYVPVLMVVVALPLTPVGIGTRDVLAAQFFQEYVVGGGTAAQRNAALAAATTTMAVALTVIDAVVGILAIRWSAGLVPPAGETADPVADDGDPAQSASHVGG